MEPSRVRDASPGRGRAGRNPSVLVIDDDRDVRDTMRLVLEHGGYVVQTAADGLEGLACLHAAPRPAVVVLDLAMPGMDGWDFSTEKARDPAVASIPVIVVSAPPVGRPPPVGATLVLRKPVELSIVLDAIAQHCR